MIFESIVKLFLLLFFLFMPYAWIHFYVIQFAQPWKNRSKYLKFLSVFSIITFALYFLLITNANFIDFPKDTASFYFVATLFAAIFAYIFIHFVTIQFSKNWSERSAYQKILTILAPFNLFYFLFSMVLFLGGHAF